MNCTNNKNVIVKLKSPSLIDFKPLLCTASKCKYCVSAYGVAGNLQDIAKTMASMFLKNNFMESLFSPGGLSQLVWKLIWGLTI